MKEKSLKFSEGKMAYYIAGKGKPIIILHGWETSFSDFKNITNALKDNYQVIGLDFLGFGNSSEPNRPLTVADYSRHLRVLIKKLKIQNPTFIAHSFGGRVVINYCRDNSFSKLILVSSAGIRHRSLKRTYAIYKYKILKRIYKLFSKKKYEELIKASGSRDYKNASNVMKKTLSNVINYCVKKDLKQIKGRTYLLWGINDEETKYSDALIMKSILKNVTLIPFYHSTHFCYIEEEDKFIREVRKILKEN